MSCANTGTGPLIRTSIRVLEDFRGFTRWRTPREEGSEGSF